MRENRKFIRLKAPIGVVYKLCKGKNRKETLSFIRDISGGGLRMLVKEDLREGDLLDIQLQIPHLEEPIQAIGEVIWFASSEERDGRSREAGVRFRDIPPGGLHQVLEYVHTIGIG